MATGGCLPSAVIVVDGLEGTGLAVFFTNETERGMKTGLTATGDLGRAWSSVVDTVGVTVGGAFTGPSLFRNSKVSSFDDGLAAVGVVVGGAIETGVVDSDG